MLHNCLFSYLLLLLLHIHFKCASSVTRMDYIVDSSNENLIFLECLGSDGQASIEAQFEFFEPTGVLRGSSRPDEGNRRRFEVTPQNEAIISCMIGNGSPSQNNLSLAAIPRSYEDDPPIVVNVLSGMPAHLTCPIPLGLLHTTLNPYNIFWMEGTEFPVPVESGSFSPDNTALTVTVTERSTFQCSLKLARCANSARCPQRNHRGPEHQINVYEPAEIVGSLADAVTFGDMAQVTCSGSGSYITINWTVTINNAMMCNSNNCDSNVIMCNSQSCDPNFLEYSENLEIIDSDIQNHRIFSTLFIDTSQLNASLRRGGQEVLDINVECTVEQAYPPDVLLSGRNPFFFTTVRVNSLPNIDTTTMSTTDRETMSTTAIGTPVIETSRTFSTEFVIIIALSVFIVLFLLIISMSIAILAIKKCRKLHQQRHLAANSLSDPVYEEILPLSAINTPQFLSTNNEKSCDRYSRLQFNQSGYSQLVLSKCSSDHVVENKNDSDPIHKASNLLNEHSSQQVSNQMVEAAHTLRCKQAKHDESVIEMVAESHTYFKKDGSIFKMVAADSSNPGSDLKANVGQAEVSKTHTPQYEMKYKEVVRTDFCPTQESDQHHQADTQTKRVKNNESVLKIISCSQKLYDVQVHEKANNESVLELVVSEPGSNVEAKVDQAALPKTHTPHYEQDEAVPKMTADLCSKQESDQHHEADTKTNAYIKRDESVLDLVACSQKISSDFDIHLAHEPLNSSQYERVNYDESVLKLVVAGSDLDVAVDQVTVPKTYTPYYERVKYDEAVLADHCPTSKQKSSDQHHKADPQTHSYERVKYDESVLKMVADLCSRKVPSDPDQASEPINPSQSESERGVLLKKLAHNPRVKYSEAELKMVVDLCCKQEADQHHEADTKTNTYKKRDESILDLVACSENNPSDFHIHHAPEPRNSSQYKRVNYDESVLTLVAALSNEPGSDLDVAVDQGTVPKTHTRHYERVKYDEAVLKMIADLCPTHIKESSDWHHKADTQGNSYERVKYDKSVLKMVADQCTQRVTSDSDQASEPINPFESESERDVLPKKSAHNSHYERVKYSEAVLKMVANLKRESDQNQKADESANIYERVKYDESVLKMIALALKKFLQILTKHLNVKNQLTLLITNE